MSNLSLWMSQVMDMLKLVKQREQFGKMIEQYLTTREALRCVIQLVDIRHKPTQDDVLMYNYLKHFEIPTIVIATKEDKIPKGKVQKHLKSLDKP